MRVLKQLYTFLPFKKQLYSVVKNFWSPPERIFRHLHFKDKFNVRVEPDKTFQIHHFGYQLENELFWQGLTGGWEKVSMDLWLKLCALSNSVFDIGANTGVYALAAKTVNPSAEVYAFEPVERVFNKLCTNVRLNNYPIHCYQLAVSDADGKAIIYDTPDEHVYSVTVNKNLSSADTKVIQTEIQITTLSAFVERENILAIDLLKIDVETHEPEVLIGFGEYLGQMKPTMLIEVLTHDVAQKLETVLAGKGYLYFDIDEENPPKLVQRLTKSSYYNYLICQPHIAKRLNLIE
jgi:FkbM family methyltransferase